MGDDRDFKNDWTDCVPITDHSNSDEPNGEVDDDKVCSIWLYLHGVQCLLRLAYCVYEQVIGCCGV